MIGFMAKGGEMDDLTRELQAADNPAQRSGVLFQPGRGLVGGKEIKWR
jgi:hypothetical protein